MSYCHLPIWHQSLFATKRVEIFSISMARTLSVSSKIFVNPKGEIQHFFQTPHTFGIQTIPSGAAGYGCQWLWRFSVGFKGKDLEGHSPTEYPSFQTPPSLLSSGIFLKTSPSHPPTHNISCLLKYSADKWIWVAHWISWLEEHLSNRLKPF